MAAPVARGWLVMMAVICSRRVGGLAGRGRGGVPRSRWVRPGLRSTGGVLMATSIAGDGGWVGRASVVAVEVPEVAHLTLRALNACVMLPLRGGS